MTGHQDHPATGKTLKGEPTYAVNLAELCKAVGVTCVAEINAFDVVALENELKSATLDDNLHVIIAKAPCVLLKGQSFPTFCYCDSDKCKKCGACLKIGCPAITKNQDGTIIIDKNACNGCGLCKNYCKFNAISSEVR